MKKLLSILLVLVMTFALTACSQGAQTPAAQETAEPSDSVSNATPERAQPSDTVSDATAEPLPEPEIYAPMDILSSEFNPYADLKLPDTFTVFAAAFNKGSSKQGGRSQFVLSMTGSGSMFACVAYHADVAGLSEDDKNERINEYLNGGFTEFEGSSGQIVMIRNVDPNDDRYEYVTADGSHGQSGGGCVIDITFFVDEADIGKYTKLVQDNYSLKALEPLKDYMEVESDFSECGFGVNMHKQQAASYVVYYMADVDAVQNSMENGMEGGWWEWNGMMQTSFSDGAIESKLTFDSKSGAITIEQINKEFNSPPSAEVSLTKLGFGFDESNVCGVYEEREPNYMSVAIHRPEWGDFDCEWNIEYMDVVNGYALRITYHESEGRYHVSVEKDGESSAYETYPAKDELGWEYPDLETVHRMFNDAFGTKEKELYFKPLERLEQLVQDRFSMGIEDLYALPIR